MTEYTKEVYLLKKKSGKGEQYYGFIISLDGKPIVKQWHKPKVSGIVFMNEDEANQEADDMINNFANLDNLPQLNYEPKPSILINYDEFKQYEPVTIGMPIKEEPIILKRTLRSLNNVIFSENKLDLITIVDEPQDYSISTNFNVNEIIQSCSESEKRNIIIDNVNTRYCIMVDSDIILDVTAFNILRQLMEDHKNNCVGSISLNELNLGDGPPNNLMNMDVPIDFNDSHNSLGCIIIDVNILKLLIKKTNRNTWVENKYPCACICLQEFLRDNEYKSGKTRLSTILNTKGRLE